MKQISFLKTNEIGIKLNLTQVAVSFLLAFFILYTASLFNLANAAKQVNPINSKERAINPIVLIETSLGNIKIVLNKEKAPQTVGNFLKYVQSHFYDGTIFHRVIKGFMIQGGGFDANFKQKPTYSTVNIESNNGLINNEGTIAMARTNDPNSASSQFFINVTHNTFLNYQSDNQPGYAVFGKVIEGMDIVKKIENVKTANQNSGMENVPTHSVMINKVSVVD